MDITPFYKGNLIATKRPPIIPHNYNAGFSLSMGAGYNKFLVFGYVFLKAAFYHSQILSSHSIPTSPSLHRSLLLSIVSFFPEFESQLQTTIFTSF